MHLTFFTTLLIVNCVSQKPIIEISDEYSSDLLTHPRITNNCGEHFDGSEGTDVEGFKLQKLFIATTSGLRVSHIHESQPSSFDQDDYLHFCSFRTFAKIFQSENVNNYLETLTIKAKLRGRKIKSGFKIFDSLPKTESCKSQSLSSFGLSQMINLGKYLFKSYYGKLKSLNSILLHSGFAATFGDETLFQSLNALLYGLLTEKQFLYINIDKSSSDFSQTTKLKDLYKDIHYFVEHSFDKESHLFKETKVFAADKISFIEMLFGSGVSVKDIISHLSSSLCPAFVSQSVKAVNLSYEDVSNIFNVSDLYNKYLTTSSTFQSYSMARTFSLRQLVKDWFSVLHEQNIDSNDKNDLKIITVDDLFMLSILTALNIPVSQHIAPSSRLIIESFMSLNSQPDSYSIDISRQSQENDNISVAFQKQERDDTLVNELVNQGLKTTAVINEKRLSEKRGFNGSLQFVYQRKNMSSESTIRRLLLPPQSPLTSKMEVSTDYAENKTDDLKLSNNQNSSLYIRVLYSGQVITAFIPGCINDTKISLGLCSFQMFEYLLDQIEWQHHTVRDEL